MSAAHDELVEAIAAGVKAEASALGATIAAIDAHIGEGEKLELDAIVEDLKASFEAALKASVLAPADGVKRLGELQNPAPDTAETALARARAAVKACADGLSLDGIARLARVDRSSLDDVAAYLDLAAAVLAGSESAAREALGQQNDDDGAGQGAQNVVDDLLNLAAGLPMIRQQAENLRILAAEAHSAAGEEMEGAALAEVVKRLQDANARCVPTE